MKIVIVSALLLLISLPMAISATIEKEPALVSAVFPVYPAIAKVSNTFGEIKMRVAINANGDVTKTEILSGHKLLDDSARYAAMQWKFEKLNNGTGARTVELIFRFTLMPRCSDKRTHTPIFMTPYKVEVRQEKSWIVCTHCSEKEEKELNCKNP